MKYRCGVNFSEARAWGHVFDLPGCASATGGIDEIEAALRLAICEYLSWLRRQGEPAIDGGVEVEITERVVLTQVDAEDGEFAYEDDLRPLTDEMVEDGLRIMTYARADLLRTVDGLPDEVLDWRPPKSAMARIDPWQPEPLTIREILQQLPQSEAYYCGCLADGPIAEEPQAHRDLSDQRERTIAVLRALPLHQRGRRFEPVMPWGRKPEHWTARKTLRRIIAHERFHTAEIQQRRTWILLGMPDYGPTRR